MRNGRIQLLERSKAEGVRELLHEPPQAEHAVVKIDKPELNGENPLVITRRVHNFPKLQGKTRPVGQAPNIPQRPLRREPQYVLFLLRRRRVLALQCHGVLQQVQLDLGDVVAVETCRYKIERFDAEQVLDLQGPFACLL